MRKEVEEIVSAKLNEGKIEGNSTSVENLLQRLIEINEEQNELLSNNCKSSNILEKLIFGFAGLALIVALASLQLNVSAESTSLGIFYLTYVLIFIGLIVLGALVLKNFINKKIAQLSKKLSIHNIILVFLVSLVIGLPITLTLFCQLNPIILIIIISIVYLMILFLGVIV